MVTGWGPGVRGHQLRGLLWLASPCQGAECCIGERFSTSSIEVVNHWYTVYNVGEQFRCLNSRWDQASPRVERLSGFLGSHSGPVPVVSLAGYTGDLGSLELRPRLRMPLPHRGVELAAAMAAKINAMLMAKGKLKTPPPLPNKIVHTVTVSSTADELVVTEVDINDVPINCRNLLTKGKTQEEIRRYSGAVVSTKGFYMSGAEKAQAKGVDRPLYLHVQGKSQEEVNKAVLRIKEMISEDLLRSQPGQPRPPIPTLTVYPQPPRSSALPQASCPPALPLRLPPPAPSAPPSQRPSAPYGSHSGNFVHTKIFVGLDQALPSFNVNEKVEGPGGSYLQHIQSETGARVFLRGKSSGYIEQASRRESFEPLYLYISHPNSTGLEAAKKLCESLLETVRAEHTQMVSVYTATGSTQAYPAHGYPANSNYSSPVSWLWFSIQCVLGNHLLTWHRELGPVTPPPTTAPRLALPLLAVQRDAFWTLRRALKLRTVNQFLHRLSHPSHPPPLPRGQYCRKDADAPASCPLNRRRATQEAEGRGGSHQRFRGFRCG
ncbi:hypothetical protein COCON_G00105260 [Conger conger]|uniref:KH homology domain-containing protein 4 n=1 Tax=Conger conger TaxID=82655 RepID=A0A9Q1DIH0_CONCO|nr:hypothetical protein COCON_G00105260 [Conger conger]